MTDKELMQMALDALEICPPVNGAYYDESDMQIHVAAVDALRARLAQPEPKSVRERVDETLIALAEAEGKNTLICPKCKADRFKVDCPGDRLNCGLMVKALPATEPVGYVYSEAWTPIKKAAIDGDIPNGTPLYTAPVKREWVGLTAGDLAEIPASCYEGAIWADGKLREKNA